MKKVFTAIGVFACLIACGVFGAFIVLDIAKLYHVPGLSELTLSQVYAIMLIVSISKTMPKTEDKTERSYDELAKFLLKNTYNVSFMYLVCWGIAYLTHYFI